MFQFVSGIQPDFVNGKFRKYTTLGGYPVFYIDLRNDCLCNECATEQYVEDNNSIMGGDINWENTELYCDICSERIESAYAKG